jgi:hypothetical protein
VDKASDKPPEKSSDKPPEKSGENPMGVAPVPVGKRTLIGIAAPIIDQKTTPTEPAKSPPPSGSAPPPAPAEPLPETQRERTSGAPREEPDEPKISRAKSPLAQTRKETPEALAAAKREARAAKGPPSSAPEKSSRLGPVLLLLLIGAGAVWFVMHKQRESEEALNEQLKPAQAEQAPQEKPPEMPATPPTTETPEPTVAAPASAVAPEPEASAATSAAPGASASPAASPSATAAATSSAHKAAKTPPPSKAAEAEPATAEGTRVVTVRLMPPDARLFYKGKSVGRSPVRIELKPGEKKRSFEVGRPGYVTRRLVVDGSEPDVSIGLRPETGAPTE